MMWCDFDKLQNLFVLQQTPLYNCNLLDQRYCKSLLLVCSLIIGKTESIPPLAQLNNFFCIEQLQDITC